MWVPGVMSLNILDEALNNSKMFIGLGNISKLNIHRKLFYS